MSENRRDTRVENVKQYFLASTPLSSYRAQLLQVIRDRVAFTANGKRQIKLRISQNRKSGFSLGIGDL